MPQYALRRAALALLLPLACCASAASAASDQRVCRVESLGAASGCRTGDLALFLRGFGNASPLAFAALRCDMEKPILLDESGVVCTLAKPRDAAVYDGAEEAAKQRQAEGQWNRSFAERIAKDDDWKRLGSGFGRVVKRKSRGQIALEGDAVTYEVVKEFTSKGEERSPRRRLTETLDAYSTLVGLGVGSEFEFFSLDEGDPAGSAHFIGRITAVSSRSAGRGSQL